MAERNRIWHENKQKKLEMIKEAKKDDGLEECTFQPVFATKKQNQRPQEPLNQVPQEVRQVAKKKTEKSINSYVNRMQYSRHLKEEKAENEKKKAGSGHVWKN